MTVFENLAVARRLHPGTPREAVDQIIERMDLAAYANRRTGNLSQGNAQRLGLAKALLHHPKLLLLDEPANGLDPAGIIEIRELLLELTREQGVTVFMSSHILAEVSRLAQRIGIIHKGRLLQDQCFSPGRDLCGDNSQSGYGRGCALRTLRQCGRGYLLSVGGASLTLIMANLVVVAGWGEYFPWAIPMLHAQGKSPLAPISYWIVFLTGLVGMLGTYLWWKFADQNRELRGDIHG